MSSHAEAAWTNRGSGGTPMRRRSLRGQQDGMLDPQSWWTRRRLHPQVVRPPRLVEEVAGQRPHQVTFRRQDVDQVSADPSQTATPSGGQVRDHGTGAGVQHADPLTLDVGQRAGVEHDESGRRRLPAIEPQLVDDLALGPAQAQQLAPREHTRLRLSQVGHASQPSESIRLRIPVVFEACGLTRISMRLLAHPPMVNAVRRWCRPLSTGTAPRAIRLRSPAEEVTGDRRRIAEATPRPARRVPRSRWRSRTG